MLICSSSLSSAGVLIMYTRDLCLLYAYDSPTIPREVRLPPCENQRFPGGRNIIICVREQGHYQAIKVGLPSTTVAEQRHDDNAFVRGCGNLTCFRCPWQRPTSMILDWHAASASMVVTVISSTHSGKAAHRSIRHKRATTP